MPTKKDNKQPAPKKAIHPVLPGECPLLIHANSVFAARVKSHVTREELENPEMWPNVAHNFEAGTRVEVHALDGSMFARCLVKHVSGSVVRMACLDHYNLDPVAADELKVNGHLIRNLGVADGWTIVLESTGEVVKDKMPNQMSCVTYLQDLDRSM